MDDTETTKQLDEIVNKLEKLGEQVNCHDGTFDTYDLLDHAEEIEQLLSRYLKLKRQ